jgi:hypothetical protein
MLSASATRSSITTLPIIAIMVAPIIIFIIDIDAPIPAWTGVASIVVLLLILVALATYQR